MSDKIIICLLDITNNKKEEINIKKPKTYYDLLEQIKKNFKKLPKNYMIFYIGKDKKEIE